MLENKTVRAITLIVMAEGDDTHELSQSIMSVLGVDWQNRWIGGTGIMLLDWQEDIIRVDIDYTHTNGQDPPMPRIVSPNDNGTGTLGDG